MKQSLKDFKVNKIGIWFTIFVVLISLNFLYTFIINNYHNFLLFHSFVEFFSISICITVFFLTWNSRKYFENDYYTLIGIACLFIGILDFIHLLAYKGMGVIVGFTYSSIQLWVAARYMQCLSILTAFLFISGKRKLNTNLTFLIYTVISAVIILSIFYWKIFPAAFIENRGLTPFKIISEYIISLIFVVDIFLLYKFRDSFNPKILRLLTYSFVFAVVAELILVHYTSVFDKFNILGHYFKIFSFYFFYLAIVEKGIRNPQETIFRKLSLDQKKQREREILLDQITKAIRSTLDINELKRIIVTEIGEFFNADRCVIAQIDPNTGKFKIIDTNSEYLKSPEFKSWVGINLEDKKFEPFEYNIKISKREYFINDIDNPPEGLTSYEIKILKEFGIKSTYELQITYGDELLGALRIDYLENKKTFLKDEFDFVKALADQIGTALHQSNLYEKERKTAEREKLIERIITKSISTLDLSQIKNYIVNEIGKLLKADRCYIVEFDLEKMTGKPVKKDGEYLASPDVPSIIGYTFPRSDVEKFVDHYVTTRNLGIFNYKKIREENREEYAGMIRYSRGLDLGIGIPFFYVDTFEAVVVIEYAKEKVWFSDEDLNFLRIIGNQAGIAFHQVKIYQETKQTAQRESLLRRITEKIRSSLDINETLTFICNEVATVFNVQRATITAPIDKRHPENITIRSEYTLNPSIISIGSNTRISKEFGDALHHYWYKKVVETGEIYQIDNISELKQPDLIKNIYESMGVKSIIGVPIVSGDDKWGGLYLSEYSYYRHWTDEEKQLLKAISSQIYVAIKQAELYSTTKQQAERETLLRRITEKIRSSLDINDTLTFIIDEVAKLYNVQRATIVEYPDFKNFEHYIVRREYKSSPDIKGLTDPKYTPKVVSYWGSNQLPTGKILAFDNIQESDTPDYFRDSYKSLGIKSIISVPIQKGEDKWGTLSLSEYNYCKHWTDEDIKLLEAISDQVYIAIQQAELYSTTKQQAERETLLRKIISTIRRTLDIDEIKKTVIAELTKIYNPDKTFIIEFDFTKEKKYIPISKISEHLSSPDIPSFVGVDFTSIPGFEYIKKLHLENKDMFFNDVDKYLEENNLVGTDTEKFFRDFKETAMMVVNITYEDELVGNLGMIYTKKQNLKEEDFEFLKVIANQIGIALHQSKLYDAMQQTTKREILLRKIIESIRSTLDIEEVKRIVVNEVGKAFNADRCLFRSADPLTGEYSLPDIEYLSSDKVMSLINVEVDQGGINYFIERAEKNKKVFYIEDIPKYIEDNHLQGSPLERYVKGIQVLSDYPFPIWDTSVKPSYLVLHYTQKVVYLSEEQIETLEAIAKQVGIAMNQAQLYETVQHNAEKEKLLKEVISQIKLSQSIDQVYNYLLSKLSDVFNVNKTFFIEISEYESKRPVVNYEFNKFEQPTLKNELIPQACVDVFSKLMQKNTTFVINDVRKFLPENTVLQEFFDKHNVKAILASPLIKEEKEKRVLGTFVLWSEKPREWTQSEIALFEEILNTSVAVIWEIMKRNELEELRNTFILTLAHDLEVPLVGERRALEFIVSIPPGQLLDKYKDIIAETIKNNQDISNFLKKLVDSYTYELGRKKLYYAETNISELINEVVDSQKELADSKSISIDIDLQENLPPINIDKDEIKKVLETLVENAITYSPKGSTVLIKSYITTNDVVICTIDKGSGIIAEVQKRLFKRYEMALAIERKIGAGLGLYLAKQIVEAHGGNIWFESKIGEGTTFCFSLPV